MGSIRDSMSRVLAVLSLLSVGAFASLPALAQPSTGSISGSVLSQDGTGLPGSLVTLSPATSTATGSRPVRVSTGDRGLFRATGLAAGTYTVTAEAPGFTAKALAPVDLAAGDAKLVTLTLAVSTVKESVTVIGNAPRDTMEAAEIRESPARDVGEALSSTPGVWKLRKGGIANDTVVRGFQSRDTNVLIDGQRIYGACPGHMDPPSFHADFAEVDRVEVAKGPFDVKNQGSLGGVVNIVTKRPETGWHATANVAGGSASYVNPSATVSLGDGAVSALGGYSYRSGEAYADGSGQRYTEVANYQAAFVDATAFKAWTACGRLGLAPAAGQSIQLAYTHQDADQVFYPYLQMDAVYDRADRLNLSWEAERLSSVLTAVKAQAYYARVTHWMTDQYRTSVGTAPRGWSMGTMAYSKTAGGKVEAGVGSSTGLTLGVEAYQRYWDTTTQMSGMAYATQYSTPSVYNSFAGLFAEWKRPVSATVSFAAAARFDAARSEADPAKANTDLYWAYNGTRSTSRSDTFPSGNVRVTYRPREGVEISGGLGSTVRIPEQNERYYALKRSGSDWVGNPDLAPARNNGLDVAVSLRRSGFYGGLNLFVNRVSNYITVNGQPRVNMVPGVMNTSARSYSNVDATLLGGEANAVATLTDRLFLSGDVSYVRGSQQANASRSISSTVLPETPPLRARTALRYDTGSLWLEAEGVFSAAQTRVDAELGEQATPGWGIANLKAGGSLAGFTLTAGITNLFGRLYYESLSYLRDPFRSGAKVPEPGRSLFVNLAWRY